MGILACTSDDAHRSFSWCLSLSGCAAVSRPLGSLVAAEVRSYVHSGQSEHRSVASFITPILKSSSRRPAPRTRGATSGCWEARVDR
eukprot:1676126-Pleurochrysis_carterae.AAC.1